MKDITNRLNIRDTSFRVVFPCKLKFPLHLSHGKYVVVRLKVGGIKLSNSFKDLAASMSPISNQQTVPEYLYHYTNYENLKEILKNGKVLQSTSSDTTYVHGAGVYLTTLAPEIGRNRLAWNNWGGKFQFSTVYLTHSPIPSFNKTECYLKIEKRSLDNQSFKVSQILDGSERDLWIHRGDILLGGLCYTVGFVDERGRRIALLNSRHGFDKWSHSIKDLTVGKITV